MRETQVFVSIPRVPVHCNRLWAERGAALNAPRGDVELAFCHNCGHVFNVAFEADLVAYTQDYDNALYFSPRFQEYAVSLAKRLITRHGLHGKVIVEIGSGQGDFLRRLCELGDNRGVGFDPSYIPPANGEENSEGVTIIPDYYSEKYGSLEADLVCCRHVLEHVAEPVAFLRTVRRAIGDRPDTVVYCEVPNVRYTLHDLGVWDIIYEHCSYFGDSSLACAFRRSGYGVGELGAVFGGQFLAIEGWPDRSRPQCQRTQADARTEIAGDVREFASKYQDKVTAWERRLEKMLAEGQRVAVWGAGSKGVTFLNTLAGQGRIDYAVDINPRKQGMYLAGTGQLIVPPAFMADYKPDVVIAMNPVYESEIRGSLVDMGLTARLELA
jgi:hypothetical protein